MSIKMTFHLKKKKVTKVPSHNVNLSLDYTKNPVAS